MVTKTRLPLSVRQPRLEALCRMVQECHACPRMEGRFRVLTHRNGGANSKVMFVAEAPGKDGADRTAVPIHGDPTGNNFERLLAYIGWRRDQVFVTNAVLCNPRNDKGNNDTPTEVELSNCSFHLESQLMVVDPYVVVTLGAKALAALSLIRPHNFVLSRDVATSLSWYGRIVFPMYHQSPRALYHRSMEIQKRDFISLKNMVESLFGGKKQ